MSDQNAPYPDQYPAPEATPAGTQPRFVAQAMSEDQVVSEPPSNGQHGLGPFTLREWIVMALAVALLILSFFGAVSVDAVGMSSSVWAFGITWLGAALFPTVAAALIAVRRFAPRVQFMGALSVDQVASVAFSVAAFLWLNLGIILGQLSSAMGDMMGFVGGGRNPVSISVIVWISFVVSLAGVFFTVVARFVPPFAEDFTNRTETVAHATARPARPLVTSPKPAPAPAPWPGAEQGQPYAYPPQGVPAQQAPTQQASTQQAPYGAPYGDPAAQQAGVASGLQDPFGGAHAQHEAPVYQAPAEQEVPAYAAPAEQEVPAYAVPAEAESAPIEDDDAQDVEAICGAEFGTSDTPDDRTSGAPDGDASAEEARPEPLVETHQEAAPATTVLPVSEQTAAAPQQAPAAQPFWALTPEQRDVHDFEGRPIYSIGPTAWALVLEDRGTYFVMRHDDGRIGYLHNTTNITRG